MLDYVVGRDAGKASIVIPSKYVSRSHLQVRYLGGDRYLIQDLNSTGGTFLLQDGAWRRISEAEITGSQQIRLADFETTISKLIGQPPTVAVPAFGLPREHQGIPLRFEAAGPANNLSMWECFTRAFTEKYGEFHGRAQRKEYWSFVLFYVMFFFVIVGFVGPFIDGFIHGLSGRLAASSPQAFPVTTILYILFALTFFVPSLAILVRRFHDVGLSGWLILTGITIVVVFLPSEGATNKHGPNPNLFS